MINSSPPGQNRRHIAGSFMNEKFCTLIQMSLKFVPTGPTDKKLALAQLMNKRGTSGKPFAPMLTQFIVTFMWN